MAKRLREGKVFIDWSQNSKSKTTVCIYSLRAKREHPYISVPFSWDELEKLLKKGDPDKFLIGPEDALKRIERFGDLFEPVLTLKQSIPKDYMKKLESPPTKSKSPKVRARGVKGTTIKDYNLKRDFSKLLNLRVKFKKRNRRNLQPIHNICS